LSEQNTWCSVTTGQVLQRMQSALNSTNDMASDRATERDDDR
jgi:hypothetical protein